MSKQEPTNDPKKNWQCGLNNTGHSCSVGPTSSGHCPGAAQCLPVRDGDRWLCNRAPHRGGPCENETPGGGPSPEGECCLRHECRPQRSLRATRGAWITTSMILFLGIMLLIFGSKNRNEWIAPGPLSSHHANVISQGTERCMTCHANAEDDLPGLLTQASFGIPNLSSESKIPQTQSSLCLSCHKELSTEGSAPMLAHGLPADRLGSHVLSEEVACAVCHQEHHGQLHDLTAISNSRCQSCHQETYVSFAVGHPDFGLWPMTRRTRINFNHSTHQAKHYLQANQKFDCATCHIQDSTGDLTQRIDYAQACASCHDAELHQSFAKGIPFLALPMLDDLALEESDEQVGSWPEDLLGDFDGDLPLFTKLLLASDPDTAQAIEQLGADFSFFDIDPDNVTQVSQAAMIARAIQALAAELQEEGHSNFQYRLEQVADSEINSDKLASLVRGLPIEFVDQMQTFWFGDTQSTEPFDEVEDRRTAGGWTIDHQLFTLRYRPSGHDDPFLRAWLDLLVSLPEQHRQLRDACLAEMKRPGAPGQCLSCHSVDKSEQGALTINWSGRNRLIEPRSFTHFSHRPHLKQPALADCTQCHTIDPTADLSASYAGYDPTHVVPQFMGIQKKMCAECHKPHAAGDHCSQCHNYHVLPNWESNSGR